MGKGDKKSKRGKIVNKSYGVRRPRKADKSLKAVATQEEKVVVEAPPKETKPKAAAKPKKKKEEPAAEEPQA